LREHAMNEISTRIRSALWWLAPLVVCAALIVWETDFGRAIRKVPQAAEPVVARPVVTSLLPEFAIAGGTAARTDTVQRTLFNPTRRPAPAGAADASRSRMQKGQFALTGTTVIDGKSTAFLRETAGGKSRRVQQGETVNGLLVAEVKPDRIRLVLGDDTEELYLRVATNPRPLVQPVAAVPGQVTATAPPGVQPAVAVPVTGPADASLAERRRAARAAQAAVQAQTSTPDGNPIPVPARPAVPAPAAVVAPGDASDPRWAEVYKAYQQPRSPIPPR
jgi:hypothetical protein